MFTPRTVITRKECSRPPPVFELNSSAPGRNRNFGTIQKPVMDRDHVGPLADAYRYSEKDDDDLATSPTRAADQAGDIFSARSFVSRIFLENDVHDFRRWTR